MNTKAIPMNDGAKRITRLFTTFFAIALLSCPALADSPAGEGQNEGIVKLTVHEYQQLEKLRLLGPGEAIEPLAAYATAAETRLEIARSGPQLTATARTDYRVTLPKSGERFVRVAANGVRIQKVLVDGRPVKVLTDSGGYIVSLGETSGAVVMIYDVPLDLSFGYEQAALPGALAFETAFSAKVPENLSGLAFEGIAQVKSTRQGEFVFITGAVPAGRSARLRWPHALSVSIPMREAVYEGELKGDSTVWTARFSVEARPAETVIPFLPRTTAVTEVRLDGAPAKVTMIRPAPGAEWHAVIIPASGEAPEMRQLEVRFEVPCSGFSKLGAEPPAVRFAVPESTITKIRFTTPGRTRISTMPIADVIHEYSASSTLSSAAVPTTSDLEIRWRESLPEEELAEKLQQSAIVAHTVRVDGGIALVGARITFALTRGRTNRFAFTLPALARVAKVTSDNAALIDWREGDVAENGIRTVSMVLDRNVSEPIEFDVAYEAPADDTGSHFEIPLITAQQVTRQHGTVTVFESDKLLVEPMKTERLAKIGPVELPPELAATGSDQLVQTFKYFESPPTLELSSKAPEVAPARIDAHIRTLLTLGDVSVRGNTSVDIDLKSGAASEVVLTLPNDTSLLDLTGPEVREYRVERRTETQSVLVTFAKELRGQIRLGLRFERLFDRDGTGAAVSLPVPGVEGVESEEGIIALEARSAIDVGIDTSVRLTPISLAEVPKALVLSATRPILHAFRYANTGARPELTAKLTRHREIPTLPGLIERSNLTSLLTPDGKLITEGMYTVRNQRTQFVRFTFPPGSRIWQTTVNGHEERPAVQGDSPSAGSPEALVRIISSPEPFVVKVLYETPVPPLRFIGRLELPAVQTDLISKESSWELRLPNSLSLLSVASNMRPSGFAHSSPESRNSATDESFGITLPADTVGLLFRKSYGTAADGPAYVRVTYRNGSRPIASVLLFSAGIVLVFRGVRSLSKSGSGAGSLMCGVALLLAGAFAAGEHAAWARTLIVIVALSLPLVVLRTRSGHAGARRTDRPSGTVS